MAEKKTTKKKAEQTAPVDEGAVEAAAEDTVVEEPAAVEAVEPEAAAEEPVAEAEPVAAAQEPGAEAQPQAAPARPGARKRKGRRVPRTLRHTHSKPKREQPAERRPIVRLLKPEGERGRRQERRGVVVSDAGDKTIVVKVDTIKAHPKYKKVVRRSAKFHAHDEQNSAKVGDVVRIVEPRPISKQKHWRLPAVGGGAKDRRQNHT